MHLINSKWIVAIRFDMLITKRRHDSSAFTGLNLSKVTGIIIPNELANSLLPQFVLPWTLFEEKCMPLGTLKVTMHHKLEMQYIDFERTRSIYSTIFRLLPMTNHN